MSVLFLGSITKTGDYRFWWRLENDMIMCAKSIAGPKPMITIYWTWTVHLIWFRNHSEYHWDHLCLWRNDRNVTDICVNLQASICCRRDAYAWEEWISGFQLKIPPLRLKLIVVIVWRVFYNMEFSCRPAQTQLELAGTYAGRHATMAWRYTNNSHFIGIT